MKTNARVVKVNPRVVTITAILLTLSWAAVIILLWQPAIFFAPLVVAISYMLISLRTRAVALKWIILIPTDRFDDKFNLKGTITHEGGHVSDQKEMGLALFILKWLTPSGCIRLESRGYAKNISINMKAHHFVYIKDKRIYLDNLIQHYSGVIKNKYLQVKWSRHSIEDISKVLRKTIEGV